MNKLNTNVSHFLYALLTIAFFSTTNAQSTIVLDSISMKNYLYTNDLVLREKPESISSGITKIPNNSLFVFGKNVSEILFMNSKGELFYNPKYFCDCKKCKRYKGMRKIELK